jgi:hypothetical protein
MSTKHKALTKKLVSGIRQHRGIINREINPGYAVVTPLAHSALARRKG